MAKYIYNVKKNPISLNDWYSSSHWTKRNKQKKEWKSLFEEVIISNKPLKMSEYRIELHVNSRHDPSNTITVIKLFEDTLKELGCIVDDSPKYCKSITIKPDENLEKPSFKIVLESI